MSTRDITRDIGIPGVNPPKGTCEDKFCPFHGTTRIRGKITQGVVVSKKSKNTIIIRMDYVHFIQKFQRYERRNSRMACHLPECLSHEVGLEDIVRVGESRKISKTKAFIVLDIIKKKTVI